MGLLLVLMQVLSYRTIIRDMQIEIYGLFIAVIFLGIGLWIGLQGSRKPRSEKSNKSKQKQIGLSDRELDVLHLMSQGLTNQQIADRLYVSQNTVKTHTSNIYSKLTVERRTQAIQKARELNII